MNNELVNEISNWRENRLLNLNHREIDKAVMEALEAVAPGSQHALQGLSSDDDGITAASWQQAVLAGGQDGSFVYPQYKGGDAIPDDEEPISYEIAKKVVAGRVARSILILNGWGDGITGSGDDWYLL